MDALKRAKLLLNERKTKAAIVETPKVKDLDTTSDLESSLLSSDELELKYYLASLKQKTPLPSRNQVKDTSNPKKFTGALKKSEEETTKPTGIQVIRTNIATPNIKSSYLKKTSQKSSPEPESKFISQKKSLRNNVLLKQLSDILSESASENSFEIPNSIAIKRQPNYLKKATHKSSAGEIPSIRTESQTKNGEQSKGIANIQPKFNLSNKKVDPLNLSDDSVGSDFAEFLGTFKRLDSKNAKEPTVSLEDSLHYKSDLEHQDHVPSVAMKEKVENVNSSIYSKNLASNLLKKRDVVSSRPTSEKYTAELDEIEASIPEDIEINLSSDIQSSSLDVEVILKDELVAKVEHPSPNADILPITSRLEKLPTYLSEHISHPNPQPIVIEVKNNESKSQNMNKSPPNQNNDEENDLKRIDDKNIQQSNIFQNNQLHLPEYALYVPFYRPIDSVTKKKSMKSKSVQTIDDFSKQESNNNNKRQPEETFKGYDLNDQQSLSSECSQDDPILKSANRQIIDDFVAEHLKVLHNYVQMNKEMAETFKGSKKIYTTLEETKAFINKNRKPIITHEEALFEVMNS